MKGGELIIYVGEMMPIIANTLKQTYEVMQQKLDRIIPEIEIKYKEQGAQNDLRHMFTVQF